MGLNTFKETNTRIPKTRLHRLYKSIWSHEQSKDRTGDINLIFTTDHRMRELNLRFRGRNRSTDVLSFVIDDGEMDGEFLGEIYISVPTAKRQADSYSASLSEEYLRLACHGMLHLFGYDHVNPEDERRMKQRENFHLDRIG